MIQHHCFLRFHPGTADARRHATIARARALGGPHVAVAVAVPADDTAAKWDLAVTVLTADLATLAAAQATPAWAAWRAGLDADAVVVKSWNFRAAP